MGNQCCASHGCITHPNMQFTCVCTDSGCFQPLCQLCKKTHEECHKLQGQSGVYRPIADIQSQAQRKIQLYLKSLQSQKDQSSDQAVKREIIETINTFFNEKILALTPSSVQTLKFLQSLNRLKSISLYEKNMWEDCKEQSRHTEVIITNEVENKFRNLLK